MNELLIVAATLIVATMLLSIPAAYLLFRLDKYLTRRRRLK